MKNKYVKRSRISEAKFRELLRFFSLDLTSTQIAKITGLNRNTVNRYLHEIRCRIEHTNHVKSSSIISPEPDTADDPICMLIREERGVIFTAVIGSNTLFSLDLQDIGFDLVINTADESHRFIGFRNPDPEMHRKKINRIENFWGFACLRLSKFKGLHPATVRLHVAECAFRYNHRKDDLYPILLQIIRNNPLF
ncbi:MAG: hypothetical protein HLUCCA01_04020 [Bacteroidetes bacterium HLUCCA01]|nr:MAG: hypothetical protein HLUCCA01_04020 [Bacteroidetes bacterium HLUCCA01]